MPDRVLRDEIWLSDRFLDLPTDACRLTFIRMVSESDDFGNLEGGIKRLFRMLSVCTQIKSETAVATTLEALIDADLIRCYSVDGRELIHLPRTRPHRQYIVRKMPASPWDVDVKLGKTQRVEARGLAKSQSNQHQTQECSNDVATTSQTGSSDVAQGVGVGVGEGVREKKEKDTRASRTSPSVVGLEGVSAEVAADWIAHRKAKRAAVTATAIRGIKREADKAGITLEAALAMCCERGWAGFKAEWLVDAPRSVVATPVASKAAEATAEYLRSQTLTPEQREKAAAARALALRALKGQA